MVVAATRGLLQPLRADDVLGRIRENLVLRQIQREMRAKATELRYLRESMAAQYVPGDSELAAFTTHRDASYKCYLEWLSHTQPYMDWPAKIEELDREEWAKDLQRWEDEWGKLDDPEVQAEAERLADFLRYGEPGDDAEYREM